MKKYLLLRLFLLVPLLFGITLVTFTLLKSLPGDPVYSMVGERASPEILEKMRAEIGSEKGAVRQYAGYLSLLLHGDLGRSYYTKRSVMADIKEKFPNTLRLALAAMVIAGPLGIMLGFVSALKRFTLTDRFVSMLSLAGISFPVFSSGLMLMLLFSLKLRLLPPSGTGDLGYLILPAVTLALPALGTIARVTRVTVMDVLDMPYVRTARAKGISNLRLHLAHVLNNGMIPLITVVGLEFGSYLNGAVLTETIFGWDGIGRFAMEGITRRDYPVIMGSIIVGTIVFVLINIAVDIIYHYADPRVRLNESGR